MMDDLYETKNYPATPGWKGKDTSQAAAISVGDCAEKRRKAVYEFLVKSKTPASAEEIAEAIASNLYSIRPRLSELQNMGLVEDSGERGRTRMGCSAVKWRAVTGSEFSDSESNSNTFNKMLSRMKRLYKNKDYVPLLTESVIMLKLCLELIKEE